MTKPRASARNLGLAVSAVCLVGLAVARAHEGHAHDSIKAKGITADAEGRLLVDEAARRAIGVTTVKVDAGLIEDALVVTGRVVVPPDRRAFASARVPGVVQTVLVRPGQAVRAGEALATLESVELVQRRQEVGQAELELAFAEANLERARAAGEAVVMGSDLLALEAERDERRSAVAILERRLAAVGAPDVGAVVSIVAPLEGTIVDVDVGVGVAVEPTQHLFEVHDLREVWIELDVPEAEAVLAATGQEVQVTFPALPGRTAVGLVERVAPQVDPARHVRHALVRVKSPDPRLAGGMSAVARLVLNRIEGGVVAPLTAIVTTGAERHVFVEEAPGTYRRKAVVLGVREGDRTEVWSGVDPGATLVTSGNHELGSLFVKGTLELDDATREAIGFAAAEVELRPVERAEPINAEVELPTGRRAEAAARIEGKIARLDVLPGDRVTLGQPVARLESLTLLEEQLELLRLDVRHGLVKRRLELLGALTSGAAVGIPRKDLLRLESEAQLLAAQVVGARRRLQLLGLEPAEIDQVVASGEPVDGVLVRAPIAGVVSELRVELGQVVRAGEPVAELVDPSVVWAVGSFLEPDVPVLPLDGQPTVVRTVAHGPRDWTGPLAIVEAALSGPARGLRACVELDNADGALLPGMQTTLLLARERPDEPVIAVPLGALLNLGGVEVAFVEREGTKALDRVEVHLGRRGATHAEVLRGLFPGDRVVVAGVDEVNNALAAVR